FRDDLATIAGKLATGIDLTRYDVVVQGRVITLDRVDGTAPVASVTITSDSQGGASVSPQLVFTSTSWSKKQSVTVQAVPNDVVDGHDALVFPPMENRVNQIRGPITIDGGIGPNPEPFLNSPLMLPHETNLPIPDGTATKVSVSGLASIIDLFATHISAQHGERPGFDPRMNDSTFSLQLLNGPAAGTAIDVTAVAKDILSFANNTPFNVGLLLNGSPATSADVQFIGTPDPATAGSVDWASARIALGGFAAYGETWTLTLDGTAYSVNVTDPNGDVASHIAQLLAASIPALYETELRTGLLGDARILVKDRTDGQSFRAGFAISSGSEGTALITGTPASLPKITDTTTWTMGAYRFLKPAAAGDVWTLQVAGLTSTHTVAVSEDLSVLAQKLGQGLTSDYGALVSGSQVTLKTAWTAQPGDGVEYALQPVNLNTRVDESTAVDTLNVVNSGSPANDAGVLTESTLTGLGMGGDTVIDGQTVPGGITYRNLESLNINLGSGNQLFTIKSTHDGTTEISAGAGANTFNVVAINGHTTINTGTNPQTVVNVGDLGLVDRIGGLLSIDTGSTGAGGGTVNVDNSAETRDTQATLTGSTLTGLNMPTLAAEQTIHVRGGGGFYL
ncbi:MAG TPA: hypothetical protein VKJ07_14900, partial [Mycobacteriales bacterium]|nr:hypothetical protein [Mycobacteriales bacterium]